MYFQDDSVYSLPYNPTAVRKAIDNNLIVWWFENNFCQSKFGRHSNSGTNSCTLIVILTASRIANNKVNTKAIRYSLPEQLINTYAQAILQANQVYYEIEISGKLANANFNIPEAMEILSSKIKSSLQEWFFVHVHIPNGASYRTIAGERLYATIKEGLQMWNMLDFKKDYIFVVLIADSRSLLICFQNQSRIVTLFDSHSHLIYDEPHGAVIVQTEWKYLKNLMFWIAEMFLNMYNSSPRVFEVSFLPLQK